MKALPPDENNDAVLEHAEETLLAVLINHVRIRVHPGGIGGGDFGDMRQILRRNDLETNSGSNMDRLYNSPMAHRVDEIQVLADKNLFRDAASPQD